MNGDKTGLTNYFRGEVLDDTLEPSIVTGENGSPERQHDVGFRRLWGGWHVGKPSTRETAFLVCYYDAVVTYLFSVS